MPPDLRRHQILEVARRMFAQRPYADISVAAIAREAGVTRALVHHYFGNVREIYLAVVGELTAEGIEIPRELEGVGRSERVMHNIVAWFDLMSANRETWQAVATQAAAMPDPHIREMIEAGREAAIGRMIIANSDIVSDTPVARVALRGVFALLESACQQWLLGLATREQAQTLIADAFLQAVEHTIPKLQAAEAGAR